MSLSALKKNRAAILDKLKAAAEKQSGGQSQKSYDDPRFWRPHFDKERGVGSAVIRFLPAAEGDDLPWAKVIRHSFKGPTGKWYIENSRRTIGENDPVSLMNGRLWNSGVESDKDVARGMKQKIEYTTWVYIVKDPANPENDGQVRLYRFGPMIFKMIEEQMFPKFDDQVSMNPFDPWEGANFNLRIVGKQIGKDTVPNYEKSEFAQCAPLGDDDLIEEVYSKVTSLTEFTKPENFKSEEELKRKLFEVLGPTVGSGVPTVEGMADTPAQPRRSVEKDLEDDIAFDNSKPIKKADDSDDDSDLEFLKSLVADL